jgi:dolichyl-phosphate-mannose-protein mannosyltransferase
MIPGVKMRHRLRAIYSSQYFWLGVILVVTLVMHLGTITDPSKLLFDENHYVPDARHIITSHQTEKPIQPPLGKLFIVAGISVFGDNPWGWRIFSVLAGTIAIALFFSICRRLGMSLMASNLATFLLAFENLSFIQASIATLDVYFNVLLLVAFLLYLSRSYICSGISIGLSALAKLSGTLALPVIGIHWIFDRNRHWRALLILILAALSFLGIMPVFDYLITHQWLNPFDRIQQMLTLTGDLTFANTQHYALSRPWEWLLNYWPIAYCYMPHYYGGISPSVWLLIMPAAIYMVYRAARGSGAALFGISWFLGTYVIWIPLSIITDRVSFVYYFYPAVGSICLGIAIGLESLLKRFRNAGNSVLRRAVPGLVVAFLVIHLVVFLLMSPLTDIVSWKFFPW